MTGVCKARRLFFTQRRFDLIFKYLFAAAGGKGYAARAYEESIRRFNGFQEFDDGHRLVKDGADDFRRSFADLLESMRRDGFDEDRGRIPIDGSHVIVNGAHRLSVAAYLDLEIPFEERMESADPYDWRFFADRGMNPGMMDWGALEYVRLNPDARIVNLFPAADPARDSEVQAILAKYGFVYYGKEIRLTYSGCVNLKKLSYGEFWERNPWIGDARDGFRGAQSHARQSMRGNGPLRVFVFVCPDQEKVLAAKAEIRALYGLGNPTVHINDTHEEAVRLAQTYFNDNSLWMINHRDFRYEDRRFDGLVDGFRRAIESAGGDVADFCGAGSTPLNVVGLRHSDDLDFLSVDRCTTARIETREYSDHEKQLGYYGVPKEEIVGDPLHHFYYRGVKFISLTVLMDMKSRRNEKGKDDVDCRLIERFLSDGRTPRRLTDLIADFRKWCFCKVKYGPYREVTVLGHKFSYKRDRRT